MAKTPEEWLTAANPAPKTDHVLAMEIQSICRDSGLEDERVVQALLDNLTRECLLDLCDDLQRLEKGEKPVGGLIKRLEGQIAAAELRDRERRDEDGVEALRDEAGDFAYRLSVERELEHR